MSIEEEIAEAQFAANQAPTIGSRELAQRDLDALLLKRITLKLQALDPKDLGSFLYHLRETWLYASPNHRQLLKPVVERIIEEYPNLFRTKAGEA